MYAVEFNTKITDNNKIEIPEVYAKTLSRNVRVIILNEDPGLYADTTQQHKSAKGIFKDVANAELVCEEKQAWGEVVKDKHDDR